MASCEQERRLSIVLSEHLAPIRNYLSDGSISEVLINGPSDIWVERGGKLSRTKASFASAGSLTAALRAIAQLLGRDFDDGRAVFEGRLPNGARVQAIAGSICGGAPCASIRLHRKSAWTLEAWAGMAHLEPADLDLLRQAIQNRKNLIISGGTGTGKTSALGAPDASTDSRNPTALAELKAGRDL